jgi:signal transduction histidine kinase
MAESTADHRSTGTGELERLRAELERARERFRSIIQKTADGMMVVGNDDGVIRFANEAAGRLFGRDPDSLVGSPFGHAVVVGETTEIDVVRSGELVVAELRVMQTEWEGEPARIISLRDITDRKKAEERARKLVREQVARAEAEDAAARAEFLAEASRRVSSTLALDETLQNVIELVVRDLADYAVLDLVDGEEVRRYASARGDLEGLMERAQEHPLRPGADTPQARTFRDMEPLLVANVDDAWLRDVAQDEDHLRLLRELGPRSVIFVPLSTGRRSLGLLSAVRTSGGAFRDRDLHLATELGRHSALAIENARLYRDVESANQAKANFLSVMSHELRTPLSAIIGYTELLDRGVVGDIGKKQSEYLGRIRASSNHLLQIIEEILAFAGAEAGKDEIRAEDTTMGALMDAVEAVAEPLARETDLDFAIHVEDDDAELHTDVRKVRQVLLNLISNALKFTEEGSVEVRAAVDGDEAVFEVEDTGVGIPPERQESIFEQFWQMEEALTRTAGGTGLGLTVARSFAELLGGTLSVESEAGLGSTFTLRIPGTTPG